MYIAVTYIGGKYVPGEPIPEDMTKEKLEWLIKAGAVRKATSALSSPILASSPPDRTDTIDHGPEEAKEAPEDDEIDEDAEIPEIDAMAGIVKDDGTTLNLNQEAKAAPARKTRATGKEGPKGGKTK